MGLLTEIGEGPVALDSSIFIYFIERNPQYISLVRPIFQAMDEGRLEIVTSSLTLLESLTLRGSQAGKPDVLPCHLAQRRICRASFPSLRVLGSG